ncbi:hypothetical protein NQ314_005562 [Rhamnusium bicolor]|uniref:Uncharacterized protein n=1 Tax=Rhamnusium bicolor TaxID=1586634 RepID=A0AAV8ZIG6_9CUCU|nr:hypothetical protein NQ314_005562 [Rhamnusium bicolor]
MKNRGCILKSEFSALLKKAIEKVENIETNIKSGFRACGIVPLSPDTVLKKIPDPERKEHEGVNEEHWTNTLKTFLHESRLTVTQDFKKGRGKKLQVPAGKGISLRDMETSDSEAEIALEDISEDEELEEERECENESDRDETVEIQDEDNENMFLQNQSDTNDADYAMEVGIFVVVKFCCSKTKANKYYVGCVTEVMPERNKNILLVNFLTKQNSEKMGEYFTYPTVKDESIIEEDQIEKVF